MRSSVDIFGFVVTGRIAMEIQDADRELFPSTPQCTPRGTDFIVQLVIIGFARSPRCMYDSLRNCRVLDERREPVSDHRVGLLPGVLCRLLILVRPEMRGAVRDAIDRYGWDLKHQHVAVALEFEAQVSARTRS